MQPAHEGHIDVFNGRDPRVQVHVHHGEDDGVAFGGGFGQGFRQERESHPVPQQGGVRCPAEAAALGGEAEVRFRSLAPENQHPNHLSQGLLSQQRARALGNAMNGVQNTMMQQQHGMQHNMMQQQHGMPHNVDFPPGLRQQQHRPMPQRQQLRMDAHPSFQGNDASPHMPHDRNVLLHQQLGMPTNQQAQQQFSGADGEFLIPASHQSSASPSPSASSPSTFAPLSPGFHQENKLQHQHEETRDMLQVLASHLHLASSPSARCFGGRVRATVRFRKCKSKCNLRGHELAKCPFALSVADFFFVLKKYWEVRRRTAAPLRPGEPFVFAVCFVLVCGVQALTSFALFLFCVRRFFFLDNFCSFVCVGKCAVVRVP
jgi:hypothetical protein